MSDIQNRVRPEGLTKQQLEDYECDQLQILEYELFNCPPSRGAVEAECTIRAFLASLDTSQVTPNDNSASVEQKLKAAVARIIAKEGPDWVKKELIAHLDKVNS